MSLIGSLEDLSLGDILQIISLSQKSGVLVIQTEDGEGRIAFRGGLVRGASRKGDPVDLREVLVDGKFVSAEEYDAAAEEALATGRPIEEALSAHTSITAERIDSLRRESVEAAVMRMFQWRKGEFSFDVRVEAEPGDPPLFLPTGLNAQYLAMEGARVDDESERSENASPQGTGVTPARGDAGGSGETLDAETSFASVSLEVNRGTSPAGGGRGGPSRPAGAAMEALVQLTTEQLAGEESHNVEGELLVGVPSAEEPEGWPGGEGRRELIAPAVLESDAEASDSSAELLEAEELQAEVALEPVLESAEGAAPEAAIERAVARPRRQPPVVVIDSELVALEWIKGVLSRDFARIHIFQRSDLGLFRIRQYLARAEPPLVLVSPRAPGDPLSGIRDTVDFVRRLKSQQRRMKVLWLIQEGGDEPAQRNVADGRIIRPSSQQIRARAAPEDLEKRAASVCRQVEELAARETAGEKARGPRARSAGSEASESLGYLKQATAALSDASTRGEVLPLVIRFAAEIFSRVAMFMVRGDVILGMAQSGLDRAGGPDDEGLRELSFARHECAWFHSVLEQRCPVRAGPSGSGDLRLASHLGDGVPEAAYVAPIESSGHVVALLYADNLPEGSPLGDSQALEVVLYHAGLALERAVLARTLAEIEGDADSE